MAEWRAAVDSLTETKVDGLSLPKFELRWKGELKQPLGALGMPREIVMRHRAPQFVHD